MCNSGRINASLLRAKVKAAMDDWISNGYKDDYDEIAAYIDQVQARDMAMLKRQYKDDLEKARLTGLSSGSDFFYTALVPGDFLQSAGWSDFSFKSSDFHSHADSKFNASGWSASGISGFLGIGLHANAGGTSQTSNYKDQFNLETFELSFKICQTMIVRPWFKTAFLMSKAWRFDQTNPDVKGDKGVVCDGGKPPKGLITAYPTTAVWVNKLCLKFGNDSKFSNWYNQQKSSSQNGAVGIAALALGGSASHWSKDGYTNQDFGGQNNQGAIEVGGPQLIGFKCHILPKCPDPDQSIKSWV
jgi:hypothetical protein